MKRILTATVAAIAMAGPMVVGAASAQTGKPAELVQYEDRRGGDQDSERRGDDARDDQRGGRDQRQDWRDNRREGRWDESRHNGYYDDGRWNYGPPRSDQYGRPGFALGYQPWARGQSLGYYHNRFAVVNYRQHSLRRPGRGYHWVQDDRGDYLLVAIRSGLIAQVIISGRYHGGRRQPWRDSREARWDDSRHNGYYRNNQWRRGPPPSDRRGVVLGYQPWERGQRLGYYQGRYSEVDYREQRLREPPRGYHWVRDDRGDYLLAAIVGGLIAEVIFSDNR